MEKTSLFQSLKYVAVSTVGAYFITAFIANFLGNHFEGALIFNWLCAVYLLRLAGPESYHYVVTIGLALLVGGIVFAVAMTPLWLVTAGIGLVSGTDFGMDNISVSCLLIVNSLVVSLYMLIGSRRMGVDPAADFM